MADIGFRKDTTRKVSTGLFRVLRKKVDQVIFTATVVVKEAFYSFGEPPVDTGDTIDTTNATAIFGNERAIIRFQSDNAGRNGYAVFPLLGLSTSAKYGPRNWLKKSVDITWRELKKADTIFK